MNLRATLQEKSSDELIFKLKSDYFSNEAKVIAKEILTSRGIAYTEETSTEFEPETYKFPKLSEIKNSFIGCFTGESTLSWAFWIVPLISLAFATILLILSDIFKHTFAGSTLNLLFMLLLLISPGIHSFCVFKCLSNSKNKFFSTIAAAVGGLNALLFTTFTVAIVIQLFE
ncbi:hypothetical protein BSZ31_00195 [Limnobacter sp. SAORIC-690]|uniref:hypothetical protein n=1 Tax=Limnobacter sp. SAORIC-690 TaxID=1923970 RepID=UPI000CF3B6B9|nr:hypothetical protein [Limnobacter sp. SAORIC-690]PQJ23631.1 hypothetical protein BSZ31_00195 [Limnobacter sp. SAORIC-690]